MTTAKSDGNGVFSANSTIPANLSVENTILVARDEMSKSNAIYIEIQGLSPGINDLFLIILIITGIILSILVFMLFTKKFRHEYYDFSDFFSSLQKTRNLQKCPEIIDSRIIYSI